jgi:ribonuclease R
MHRLGDAVEVRLVEAAPVAGALRFERGGRIRDNRAGKPFGRRQDPAGRDKIDRKNKSRKPSGSKARKSKKKG